MPNNGDPSINYRITLDQYVVNDMWDKRVVDTILPQVYSSTYKYAKSHQVASQQFYRSFSGTCDQLIRNTGQGDWSTLYGIPSGSYVLETNTNVVPYYSERMFVDKYGYNKPISLRTIAFDNLFHFRMIFFIDEYCFMNVQVIPLSVGKSLIIIPTDDTNGISPTIMTEFITKNSSWSMIYEPQSDSYFTFRTNSTLLAPDNIDDTNPEGGIISLNNFSDYKRLIQLVGRRNAFTMYITSAKHPNLLSITRPNKVIRHPTIPQDYYFQLDKGLYNHILTTPGNKYVWVFSDYRISRYTGISALGNGDTRKFILDYNRYPSADTNIIVLAKDETVADTEHVYRRKFVVKFDPEDIYFPNIWDITRHIPAEYSALEIVGYENLTDRYSRFQNPIGDYVEYIGSIEYAKALLDPGAAKREIVSKLFDYLPLQGIEYSEDYLYYAHDKIYCAPATQSMAELNEIWKTKMRDISTTDKETYREEYFEKLREVKDLNIPYFDLRDFNSELLRGLFMENPLAKKRYFKNMYSLNRTTIHWASDPDNPEQYWHGPIMDTSEFVNESYQRPITFNEPHMYIPFTSSSFGSRRVEFYLNGYRVLDGFVVERNLDMMYVCFPAKWVQSNTDYINIDIPFKSDNSYNLPSWEVRYLSVGESKPFEDLNKFERINPFNIAIYDVDSGEWIKDIWEHFRLEVVIPETVIHNMDEDTQLNEDVFQYLITADDDYFATALPEDLYYTFGGYPQYNLSDIDGVDPEYMKNWFRKIDPSLLKLTIITGDYLNKNLIVTSTNVSKGYKLHGVPISTEPIEIPYFTDAPYDQVSQLTHGDIHRNIRIWRRMGNVPGETNLAKWVLVNNRPGADDEYEIILPDVYGGAAQILFHKLDGVTLTSSTYITTDLYIEFPIEAEQYLECNNILNINGLNYTLRFDDHTSGNNYVWEELVRDELKIFVNGLRIPFTRIHAHDQFSNIFTIGPPDSSLTAVTKNMFITKTAHSKIANMYMGDNFVGSVSYQNLTLADTDYRTDKLTTPIFD